MSKNQNPLGIRTGDTVRISFDFKPSCGAFTAEVIEVVDRTDMGCDHGIAYIPEESARDLQGEKLGIPYGCSISYVTEVLKKAPYIVEKGARPKNIFLDQQRRLSRDRWPGYYTVGGIKVCYANMSALVSLVLAHANGIFDRPLDMDKFHALWENSKFLGKVEVPTRDDFNEDSCMNPDIYTAVNWKVFKKFVLSNKEKILSTRKEMIQDGIRFHEAMWKDQDDDWDDIDLDFEEVGYADY